MSEWKVGLYANYNVQLENFKQGSDTATTGGKLKGQRKNSGLHTVCMFLSFLLIIMQNLTWYELSWILNKYSDFINANYTLPEEKIKCH